MTDAAIYKRAWRTERIFVWLKSHASKLQWLMVLFFIALIALPLVTPTPKAQDTIFTNTTLLSQWLFWGVWYGGTLLSVLVIGRFWCGALCPLGAASQWIGSIGFQIKTPRWLRSDSWLVVMFVCVTVLGQTLDVRDDPWGMLKIFSYIFTAALLVGLMYGKNKGRPWCRYLCPIGKILGIVSRLSILDFRPNSGIKPLPPGESYYITGRLCPTDYNLPYKTSNNNCIACGGCTSSKKNAGLGVYWRQAGSEIKDILHKIPSWAEVIFILISPGLAAGGFLWLILNQYQNYRQWVGTWALTHGYTWFFSPASPWLGSSRWNQHFNYLDILCISSYMILYALAVATLLSICLLAAAWALDSPQSRLRTRFKVLAYQLTPVAILSIVIGLCGKFFTVLQSDCGLPSSASIAIKCLLFGGSIVGSLYLFKCALPRLDTQFKTYQKVFAWCFFLTAIAVLIALWYPAIFNVQHLSTVEKIRRHLIQF